MVSTYAQPNSQAQSGSQYKANIDGAAAVHHRLAGAFAPHENDIGSPAQADLTVRLDAGFIPTIGGVPVTVAAQSTASLTAPTSNPRKDIVYIDASSGAIGVATGTPAGSPSDPAVPAGKIAVARINWAANMTEITNADLDDLRNPAFMALGNAIGLGLAISGGKIVLDKAGLTDLGDNVDGAADYALVWDATASSWKITLVQNMAPGEDQVARDMAIVALISATSTGGVRGPVVSMVANSDHFSTKTGATFATDHYTNNPGTFTQVPQATGTVIGNMTASGGNAAAFDSNTNQAQAAAADTGKANTAGYVGKSWGSGNAKIITKYVAYATNDSGFNRNFGGSVTIQLRGSNTNDVATAAVLHTDTFSDANSAVKTYTSGINTATAYLYHWVYLTQITNGHCLAEAQLFTSDGVLDMTLSDDAETIAAGVDEVDIYVLEKAVDASPTRRVRVQLGGGSWSSSATLENTFTFSDKTLYRYNVDVSALAAVSPTPTTIKGEYNTLNDGKERYFYRMDLVPLYAS